VEAEETESIQFTGREETRLGRQHDKPAKRKSLGFWRVPLFYSRVSGSSMDESVRKGGSPFIHEGVSPSMSRGEPFYSREEGVAAARRIPLFLEEVFRSSVGWERPSRPRAGGSSRNRDRNQLELEGPCVLTQSPLLVRAGKQYLVVVTDYTDVKGRV